MVHGQWRKLHKWIFIFMGVFLFAWLISGMVMLLPSGWFGPEVRAGGYTIDYRAASLSPADAIARIEARSGVPLEAASVRLQRIRDQLLYAVKIRDGEEQLVDASTGAYFEVTPELAESVARAGFGIEEPVAEIVQLHEHDISYPWGALPVFRVRFVDDPSVAYLVDQRTARVSRSSTATRVRTAVSRLHDFQPIELLTGSAPVRKALLLLTCAIGLLGVITGYYLVFSVRRRRV